MQQTTGYGGKDTRDDEQRSVMEAQDKRRGKAKLSVETKRAALAVDREDRRRQVVLFDPAMGAPPPSAGPSVMRRPAALHSPASTTDPNKAAPPTFSLLNHNVSAGTKVG